MKNTQLRNLNKIYHKGVIRTVDGIVRGHVCFVEDVTQKLENNIYGPWVDLDEVEFIPLSEEILLKCGFVNEFSNSWSDHSLQIFENKGNVAGADIGDFYISTGQRYVCSFKYLHQLQNLYFALTGQELNTSGL